MIQGYVTLFFGKPCCFDDLKQYLSALLRSETHKSTFINWLVDMNDTPVTFDDEKKLRRFIVSSQLLNYYGGPVKDDDLLLAWEKSLRDQQGEQDVQRGDELVQLYAERKFNAAMMHEVDSTERVKKVSLRRDVVCC